MYTVELVPIAWVAPKYTMKVTNTSTNDPDSLKKSLHRRNRHLWIFISSWWVATTYVILIVLPTFNMVNSPHWYLFSLFLFPFLLFFLLAPLPSPTHHVCTLSFIFSFLIIMATTISKLLNRHDNVWRI